MPRVKVKEVIKLLEKMAGISQGRRAVIVNSDTSAIREPWPSPGKRVSKVPRGTLN